MKPIKYIFILIIPIFLGCEPLNVEYKDPSLIEFNDFLGLEKSNSLDEAVISFENFLNTNYSTKKNINERTLAFLQQLDSTMSPDSNWLFDSSKNGVILKALESSGMRIEIYRFGYEEYSPDYPFDLIDSEQTDTSSRLGELTIDLEDEELIPISDTANIDEEVINERIREQNLRLDSTAWFNIQGQFLYGLTKYGSQDSIIKEYIKARNEVGFISTPILISALLSNKVDYTNPFVQRILVTDIYLDLMRWDIKRNN